MRKVASILAGGMLAVFAAGPALASGIPAGKIEIKFNSFVGLYDGNGVGTVDVGAPLIAPDPGGPSGGLAIFSPLALTASTGDDLFDMALGKSIQSVNAGCTPTTCPVIPIPSIFGPNVQFTAVTVGLELSQIFVPSPGGPVAIPGAFNLKPTGQFGDGEIIFYTKDNGTSPPAFNGNLGGPPALEPANFLTAGNASIDSALGTVWLVTSLTGGPVANAIDPLNPVTGTEGTITNGITYGSSGTETAFGGNGNLTGVFSGGLEIIPNACGGPCPGELVLTKTPGADITILSNFDYSSYTAPGTVDTPDAPGSPLLWTGSDHDPIHATAIPEPATFILLGLGLAGTGVVRRIVRK